MSAGRIIHAVSSLQIGGAERLVVDLAVVQKRRGFEPLILNFGRDTDPLCADARARGIAVQSLAGIRTSIGRTVAILRALRKSDRTALHVHSPWCLPRLGLVLPFFSGSVIYTRHGANPYDSLYWKMVHRWTHRFMDYLTFVSPQSLEVHVNTHGVIRQPRHLVAFGVDIPARIPARSKDDMRPVRIGCVGRLVKVKGQRVLIDALAHLKSEVAWEMHFFGDGPDRAALEEQARAVTNGHVVFHGTIMDRSEIYSGLDVLVVSSKSEGRSLAIMEAMSRQIPVLATDVGGNSQLVRNRKTGLLVPYGDRDALASALDELLDHADLRSGYGSAARDMACSTFSLESCAAGLEPLYELA